MDLTASQAARLQTLLQAGFRFVTLERVERYLGVERDGFVALIDPAAGGLKLFGQAGLRIADGIGILVERRKGKTFVWHDQSVPATPELLARYRHFCSELERLLGGAAESGRSP